MPIGAGIIQINKISVYSTTSELFNIVPDGYTTCGNSITFNILVNNTNPSRASTIGSVFVMDQITGVQLATGSLSGGAASLSATLPSGYINPFVLYDGYINKFSPSKSDGYGLYYINTIKTKTTVTTTPGDTFRFGSNFTIHGNVVRDDSGFPTGTLTFNLYSDNINFVTLGTSSIDGSGNASAIIPANSTTVGNSYWINIIFIPSNACYSGSSTPSGESGTVITAVS